MGGRVRAKRASERSVGGGRREEGRGERTGSILSDLGNHQHLQLIRNAINTAICFLKLNKAAKETGKDAQRQREIETE